SLVQDVSQVLKNVEVEGFDSRVNVRTDGSIKENVPEGEDALGDSSSKQKKEQKKSKNESDQEETTDAWGFEKPSTSGVPQKVKTISWEQGIGGIGNSIHDGELENLWVNEKHDTTKGKKLFIDILTNVNGISNVVFENTSKYTPGESIIPATDMGYLRMFYRNLYPNLDRQGLEELAQVTSLTSRLAQKTNVVSFARNDWKDQVQERERMQLKGPSVFLVGASHTLQHEAEDEYSMQNANAYPAYQHPNPNKSIALVPEQIIKNLKFMNRKNTNAAPEYAVWVKSQDESMNDPFLVMGQKSDMEKAFGNKIRLLPKRLSDLNSATKYESRIIIQESDDEIANTATKNLVKKLQKKYNKEDIVVIKRVNEALVVTEGNMKNIKGEYKVNVIGHGDEDKRGVMRLGGKNGAQIVQDLKSFEWRMSHVKLAKVSLMSCLSGTCGASGRSLVGDFRQALNDNTVKIKGYNDRIDLDSEGHAKPVLHGGLLRDNKDTPNTKPQQQVNPSNQPTAKNPKDTNTPIKHESHIIIQKADDSTTDKARKNLVNKLN
ncbi:hypothetical protein BSPLISOX_1784, partial [uncultured Gammaproteobacteria bacterium]